jgi:hypothetical protein
MDEPKEPPDLLTLNELEHSGSNSSRTCNRAQNWLKDVISHSFPVLLVLCLALVHGASAQELIGSSGGPPAVQALKYILLL